ncbi:hypothetical protein A1Q1_01868 [Trichosporon asahii var. asahii CBS 2479]|uniref:Uncharacterized protein n=1 Tax=Trichosporon asahii var. asahii (strain ATCC 90039 / CBS 2479 / JCM 2466 / KCTC 7840 / NBRC 103889/ NCYC 2677 / UAMH 7654) TaxID=1186058 RepID=J6F1L0_TRIAS|nr:hypothetical protein A1Q1_01868 [Trichosporon asahii var. asahii CBS 2479]EJT49037.1 hypothetical protein A1Q1_01868 [Trichosporon asahii var. asahii CBS 2479]
MKLALVPLLAAIGTTAAPVHHQERREELHAARHGTLPLEMLPMLPTDALHPLERATSSAFSLIDVPCARAIVDMGLILTSRTRPLTSHIYDTDWFALSLLTQFTSPDHLLEYEPSMAPLAIPVPFPGPYPSLRDPDVPGITFSKEKGWVFHGAPDNMNFVLPMGTIGGDIYPRTITLTNQHHEQEDTSLNKMIWGGLPITKTELDAVEQAVDDNLKDLNNLEPGRLQQRITDFEAKRAKACVGVLMRILHEEELAADDPADLYLNLAQAPKWEPLTQALYRTSNLVSDIDPLSHISVAALYALSLLELHPWINSPILVNSDPAFAVIAPLQRQLWGSLAEACLTHAQSLLGPDEDAAARWAKHALRVSQICLSDRYITRDRLFSAFQGALSPPALLRIHQLTKVMSLAQIVSVPPTERRVWATEACTPAQAEAKLRDGQSLMRIAWSSLYLLAEFGTDWDRKSDRAHDNCLTSHTCGTYDRFVNFMQDEFAQKQVHGVGHMAIYYDPTPCGLKNGLPHYCCERGGCGVKPKELCIVTP